MVHSPNDALQSHKVSGQNSPRGRVSGQKSLTNPENPEKLSLGRGGGGGGTGVGDHLGTCPPISISIDGTSTKFFMADSPSDNIQTHKVSGQNSPRDTVGGQKSLENPEKVMKSCPSAAPGRALARTGAKRGHITIEPQNHRTTEP